MSFSAWLSTHYEEKGLVKWLAFFLEVVAAVTLLILMLLTCTDVLGRYLFDNSLDAASELTEICIAILVFAEMPIITWRGGHVVVDILDRFIGKKIPDINKYIPTNALKNIQYYSGKLNNRGIGASIGGYIGSNLGGYIYDILNYDGLDNLEPF